MDSSSDTIRDQITDMYLGMGRHEQSDAATLTNHSRVNATLDPMRTFLPTCRSVLRWLPKIQIVGHFGVGVGLAAKDDHNYAGTNTDYCAMQNTM